MKPTYPAFSKLLRQARQKRELTQAAVAKAINVATPYYNRIERGRASCSLTVFAALRRVLPFDANELTRALGETSKPVEAQSARLPKSPHDATGPHEMFARKLRPYRLQRHLSQAKVAESIDCSTRFYQRVEAGLAHPSLVTFARLHHLLEFDANILLEAFEQPPAKLSPAAPYARLGAFLANARIQAALPLRAAAETIGCSPADYKCIEVGTRLPTLTELAALHRLLGFNANTALRRILSE